MSQGQVARLVGLLLLLVSQVAMGIVCERRDFMIPWALGAILAAVWPRPVVVGAGMTLVYIGLPHAVLARVYPVMAKGVDLSLGFYLALYLQTLGVLALAGPPGPARTARILGASGLSVTAMGVDADRGPYLVLAAMWSALALAALRLERGPTVTPTPNGALADGGRARAVVLAITMALVLGLSATGVKAVDAVYDEANRIFYQIVNRVGAPRGAGGGFSNESELGSVVDVQGAEGEDVALRAWGPTPPGYLRAKVWLRYGAGRWTPARPDAPDGEPLTAQNGRVRLPGRPPAAEAAAPLTVQPVGKYGLHLFLPLEAAEVRGLGDEVVRWPGNVLTSPGASTARGYEVRTDPAPVLAEGQEPVWRELPKDPALLAALDAHLASAGLSPAKTDAPSPAAPAVAAAVEALARRAVARWRYHVGISFEPGEEPLVAFLTKKDHGHCELFAASGTLLLRRLGIPARYVTGFVCDERSPWGEMWIARGRHAHAWVEAWAPGAGWTTVELTPPNGVPSAAPASGGQALKEWIQAHLARLWALVKSLDLVGLLALGGQALLAALAWLVGAWWRVLLLALGAGGLLLRAWRRRLAARPPARVLPPELLRERAALVALGRRLGVARGASETLLAWADRVEGVPGNTEHAARIRAYAHRRFAPASINAE